MLTKIDTRFLEEELFEATNEFGASSRFDSRKRPEKKYLSPVESLLGALATCIGIDVVSILKKKRKTVTGLTIKTEGVRRETHPRALTAIQCKFVLTSPDTTVEELSKITHLAKKNYCSVSDSLKPEVELLFEVNPA